MYTVRYTNDKGECRQKTFAVEKDAVEAYEKLQSLKEKYHLSKIEAHDGFCFYHGNGIWD